MKSRSILLSSLILGASIFLSPHRASADFFRGDILFREALLKRLAAFDPCPFALKTSPSDVPSDGFYDQLLNPDDPTDTRTFKQRYFIEPKYAKSTDAPVIYVICGESTCDETNFAGAPSEVAQNIGAYLVALEHRYYGQSQPFTELTVENMKYLKTGYALADLARFQNYATQNLGLKGTWVAMGGSYAGVLAAYYRELHPELIAGALASSAPVDAKTDFEELDLSIAQTAGDSCAAAMRKVVAKIEASSSDKTQLAKYKSLFEAEDIDDFGDFMMVVADMGTYAMQYGMRAEFCGAVTNSTDPVEGYARAGKKIFSYFYMTPFQDSFQSEASTDPADYSVFGARQWSYQSCTEFGFWQTAYHDPAQSVRSSVLDLDFYARQCAKYFNVRTAVDTDPYDKKYYQPLLDPSTTRILFTNGTQDPWSELSITQEAGNATNPNLSYFMIEGGSHCSDLTPTQFGESSSLSQARAAFRTLLSSWL
jgi:pimeloyl-ACP methyl ester carboxylesterase